MKKLKAVNPELIELIRDLKNHSRENQSDLWRCLARHLSDSKCSRIALNMTRKNSVTTDVETRVVPGKVMGAGKAKHPLNRAPFAFTERAQSKIKIAKGKCLSIRDLMKKNPSGKNVKIMG